MRRLLDPVRAAALGFVAAAAALAPVACVSNDAARATVRVRAASDLDCPEDELHLREDLGGVFFVQGCGRVTRYRTACDGVTCSVAGEGEASGVGRERPSPR